MAQTQWTYHGASGRSHHIGLYHGDDSGHVIIYCNNNILTIDFDVKEPKSYSFYLEQDLCELSLSQDEGAFEYDFKIVGNPNDNEADDKSEVLDFIYVILAALLLMGIIITAAIGFS
jgi:hypothetical protein